MASMNLFSFVALFTCTSWLAKASNSHTSCWEVSVEADATFCIEGPICSGSDVTPTGTNCPKKDTIATAECWDYMLSYAEHNGCIAPVDAECTLLDSGAWGCVWNTKGDSSLSNSTSASGSGLNDSAITISETGHSNDVHFPINKMRAGNLSNGGSSFTNPSMSLIVGVIAVVAGIVCALAVATYYRCKQRSCEESPEFVVVVETSYGQMPIDVARTPLTPPIVESKRIPSKSPC